jgi:hypothetical protein
MQWAHQMYVRARFGIAIISGTLLSALVYGGTSYRSAPVQVGGH